MSLTLPLKVDLEAHPIPEISPKATATIASTSQILARKEPRRPLQKGLSVIQPKKSLEKRSTPPAIAIAKLVYNE